MASVKSVDEASVEKKLIGVKSTQESIQSLCLWALYHKAQHDSIVRIWLNVLKKSKIQRRLILFYLCNEIVQTCKRKHAIMYKDAFKEVLRDAVLLVRDNSVRNNIERIFTIWEERGIYDSEFIEDLIAILNNTKIRQSAAKLLAAFKPSKLRENIGKIAELEKETEVKRRRMSSLNIDITNQNYLKLLKDRSHGKQYTQPVEDSHCHLQEYVSSLEKEVKEKQAQQELLEQSELFYDAQYGEAKIVTNAYKNFGTRVTNLRKKLDDVRKTLPDPLSPIPSPTMDAPSPVESVAEPTEDNNETIDMEMSDAEDEDKKEQKAYSPSNAAPSTPPLPPTSSAVDTLTLSPPKEMLIKPLIGKSISLPSAPENSNSPPDSPVTTDVIPPIDYNSTFLSRLPAGGLASFSLQFNNSSSETAVPPVGAYKEDNSPSAEDDDGGGGTPVQDEKPEAARPTVDPVALLNQLLNCTKKSGSGGTDFLKSLSALTHSMNVPFKPPSKEENPKKRQIDGGDAVSQQSKSTDDQSLRFQPFYHSEDYLSAKPCSSRTNSGSNGQTVGPRLHVEPNVTDSNQMPLHRSDSTELDESTLLPPPPLPPALNFSSLNRQPTGHVETSGHSKSGVATASYMGGVKSNGNIHKMENEGILNMRPDLVEMLKNALNTTKSALSLGQRVPDVVESRPPARKTPAHALYVPVVSSAAGCGFNSAEDNGEYVESLNKTSGFSSPVGNPLKSPQNFQHYMNAGQQRMSSAFSTKNEFQGPNWDAHNLPGFLDRTPSKEDQVPMVYDSYNPQALSKQPYSIRSPIRMPLEGSHQISPMVSMRNVSEFTPPEMSMRISGLDYIGTERYAVHAPHIFDVRPGLNRFHEPPYFDSRFRPDFNPGRHFAGGPHTGNLPLHPPPRFVPRGFYPPY